MIGLGLTAITGAVALSMPVWTAVMKRTSKRTMWLSGALIALVGYGLLWRYAGDAGVILLPLAVIGFGAGASYLGFWAMMPDTVEYGQFKTGIRSEGGVFGVVSLIQKGALGLAAALLGELLAAIGYRANVPQSAATLAAMESVMVGGAAALVAVAAVAIAFYPIDGKLHARLRRAVERRGRAVPTE